MPTRATGNLDYQIKETRLLEFTDIGLGMDKACLDSFIGHRTKEEGPPRSTREWMRKTVKEMPAWQSGTVKELSFRPLEQENRESDKSCNSANRDRN